MPETQETIESIIRALVKGGHDPVRIVVGVHNAFTHGTVLEESCHIVNDAGLEKLIDSLGEAITAMEKTIKE